MVDDWLHVRLVEARGQMCLGGSDTNSIADTLTKRTCNVIYICEW